MNTTVLPATGDGGRDLLGVEDAHFAGQPLDDAPVVRLAEIGREALDHRVADLVERVHLRARVGVALGEPDAGVMKRLPRSVGAGERARGGVADMADAERIDEAFERDLAARRDRREQVAHGQFAIALAAPAA